MILTLLSNQLEIIATSAGLINVYLAARGNNWNWLFGGVTAILYMIIFFHVKLYADMVLQIIFLSLQFYGYWQWQARNSKNAFHLNIMSKRDYGKALIAFLCLFLLFVVFLKNYTDSNTILLDAFTTALSVVGQWMMCKKWIENWLVWMIVDLISIKMYLIKYLYYTSFLYSCFFIICGFGYLYWKNYSIDHKAA